MITNTGASKLVAVGKLVEHPRNVNEGDVGAIHQSIEHNGFYGALVVQQSTGHVLVGNHRLRAAKAAGLDRLPVFYVDVDDERALKIMLADNRTGELASRDEAALAALLTEIAAGSGLDGTGYDGDDLDELLADLTSAYPGAEDPGAQIDRADELREQWGTATGQVWVAGAHRLVCGDSRDAAVLEHMTGGARVDMLLTDPPYGINLDTDYSKMPGGNAKSKINRRPNTYRRIAGDGEAFDPAPVSAYFAATKEQFWFGADYYRRLLSDDDRDGSWLVWDKRNEETDVVIGSGFELLWSRQAHKRDLLRHYWNGALGSSEARGRSHPTQKPVPLLREIITRWSQPGATVADPYLGVGSVIVACREEGRVGCGVEIDPAYVAVTLQRLHDMGITPTLQ